MDYYNIDKRKEFFENCKKLEKIGISTRVISNSLGDKLTCRFDKNMFFRYRPAEVFTPEELGKIYQSKDEKSDVYLSVDYQNLSNFLKKKVTLHDKIYPNSTVIPNSLKEFNPK